MLYVALFGRVLIATVFAVSAFTKVRSAAAFGAFRRSTRRMAILPERLVRPVAVLVVGCEVAIVLLLAAPTRITGALGLGLAAALLTGLAGAIGLVVWRGVSTTCQCFGHSAVPLGKFHIWRNLTLIAIAAVAAVAGLVTDTSPDLGGALLAGLAGVLGGALVTVLDDVRQLLLPPKTSAARQRSPQPTWRRST
ncbi:MauE/DoxX family redox-associated membrane protein [Dactylosporangium salmoneum]|uniref:Methylamine utilisation protein MauE domain-containing protein n=1 Tax=Dactylosporangium salmoneum TaxID=53361 RepID=A0ABP5SJK5_9ACTN